MTQTAILLTFKTLGAGVKMLPKIEICHQRLGRSCNSYQFSQDFCFHFVVLLAFFALFFAFNIIAYI